jgi:putative transposase
MFEFFDPRADFGIRYGNLPHWYQPGATYFITFRTADSVPLELSRSWHRRRAEWLRLREIDPESPNWLSQLSASDANVREYDSAFTRDFMTYLDRGHGVCPFRDPRAAKAVSECLVHFDGVRYSLGDFIVMPNHVHLLVCLQKDITLEAQCESWKSFAARQVNRLLGRRGRLWQSESFDHLVRSPEHFLYFQRYIAENSINAGLRPGEYLHRPLS